MTELADAATVRRWVAGEGRNMSVAMLRRFRSETGLGISRAGLIEILAGTRMKPTLDDFEVLPTPVPTDASMRAEVLVHLQNRAATIATADDLGQFVREVNQYGALVDFYRLTPAWKGAIERLETQVETAWSIAGDYTTGVDVADMTFEQALATRDRGIIGTWAQHVREAARYARIDVLHARGLEDVVDDALVRAADLV